MKVLTMILLVLCEEKCPKSYKEIKVARWHLIRPKKSNLLVLMSNKRKKREENQTTKVSFWQQEIAQCLAERDEQLSNYENFKLIIQLVSFKF